MVLRRPSGFIEPCRPTKAAKRHPVRSGFTKNKHDGYRLMVRRDSSRVRCFTRNGQDRADHFAAN